MIKVWYAANHRVQRGVRVMQGGRGHLVLTRQAKQSVDILVEGVLIQVRVFEIRWDRVILTFDAPHSVIILRTELHRG